MTDPILTKELSDKVWLIIEDVSECIIMSYYNSLKHEHIHTKANSSIVTDADVLAEKEFTKLLGQLIPGCKVMGEEAYEANPDVAKNLKSKGYCWVIDPIDGTANFATKKGNFGVLIALVKDGQPIGGWLYDVPQKRGYYAFKDQGVFDKDHNKVSVDLSSPFDETKIKGYANPKYFQRCPDPIRKNVTDLSDEFCKNVFDPYASVIQYMDLLNGVTDFVITNNQMPWDHAAGQLMISELKKAPAGISVVGNKTYNLEKPWRLSEDVMVTTLRPKVEKLILSRLRK
tara:strand:+ start:417 stop:1274 length:858 start_codon:yes stop_codon:yes gene_type:complete